MQNRHTFGSLPHSATVRERLVLCISVFLLAASLIAAGTLRAAVRTGGTGLYDTFGVIEDFGSIVVNGVHYDESRANIIVNGEPNQPRSALKLGMVVSVEADLDYTLGTGVASRVTTHRAMLGQIERINTATGEIRVLAQRIATDFVTRFDGTTGLAQLSEGDWVAVHGLNDPARNLFAATLVERLAPASPLPSEIRGVAGNVRNGRFRIGSLDVVAPDAQVTKDDFVAVKGVFDASAGLLVASDVVVTRELEIHEDTETEIEGYVADLRSRTEFSIAGVVVDARAAEFSGGTANDLKPGVRIKVEGTVTAGVLVAEEITFPATTVTSGEDSHRSASIELEGAITAYRGLDDFIVKGKRIDATNANVTNKTDLSPCVGMKVHVKGIRAADGSVTATSIKFEKP